jgi:hypothetical protein
MRTARRLLTICAVAAAFIFGSALESSAWAHCDGLDGPVVQAARTALETGNVNHVLIWVKQAAEGEIKQAFQQALAVRKLGADAKSLADRHFFDTVVRIHRQGEGAGFTGLKPAGRDLGPAIPAADKAVASGSIDALAKLLAETVEHGLRERFAEVMEKKPFNPDEVAKGQEFVEAYVSFVHYVERIYDSATHKAQGHHPEH